MKKTFSILLALALMLTSVLPFSASAAEVQPTGKKDISEMTQEDILEIAQAAFPDVYATSQAAADYCDTITELGDVVASGTKALSDTESISYYTYTTGLTSYLYYVNFYQNSSSSGSGYTTINTDIAMTVNGLVGTMYISGFQYTIYTSAYDKINAIGSLTSGTSAITYTGIRWNETSSAKARVIYSMVFSNELTSGNVTVSLQVEVGNNTRSYSVY